MAEPDALLARFLDADRALREARLAFLGAPNTRAVVAAVRKQIETDFADASDEAGARLIALADVLVELGGVDAAQLLVQCLGHEDPGVRVAAGESLVELLYDRYGEVARVLEAEVDKGGNPGALAEIPFILAEVGEPGGVKIVSKLLKHSNPDVVGAAIEGLAALGDPSVTKALEALRNDKRTVTMDEDAIEVEGGEPEEVTIGELASEAIEHLRRLRTS